MLFSFLLPTRGRLEWCIESLRSIRDLAHDKNCFEVLLAFDDDDDPSIRNSILMYCEETKIHHKHIITPRYGYKKLNFYYNTLSRMATGDYLWLWNDDAFLQTAWWDIIMKENIEKRPDVVWDFQSSFYGILPLVPRKYIDTMKHFSLHAHNDTWIVCVFRDLMKLWELESRIRIKHIHTDFEDVEYNHPAFLDTKGSFAHTAIDRDSISTRCLYYADCLRIAKAHFPNTSVVFPDLGVKKRVGFVGMGKLGLPVAVGMAAKGHVVYGYDIAAHTNIYTHPKECLHTHEADEMGFGSMKNMLETTTLRFLDDMDTLVAVSEMVFVAVQTPHDAQYEGITRIPDDRKDFDYNYLVDSITKLSEAAHRLQKKIIVIIISTVLPGTLKKYILPVLSPFVTLCYNPYFIAMGTVLRDFYHPEFILLGANDKEASDKVTKFYSTICDAPVFKTSVENAELIKVCYNTMISTKIAFANTIMELCDKIDNTNIDDVTTALGLATRRITSAAYLTGGMGDGGGCHPRDNIAMSWLSKKQRLSYDWFDNIMIAREQQTEYMADLIEQYWKHYQGSLDVCILGKAFKPNTNLVTGSPSLLLKTILDERNIPSMITDYYEDLAPKARIYFIGTKHDRYADISFSEGSVIIDPHRYISDKGHYAALHSVGNIRGSRNRIERQL